MKQTKFKKTVITEERVKIVLENMDLPDKVLSEQTGLWVKLIRLIKEVERKGLRGPQYGNG